MKVAIALIFGIFFYFPQGLNCSFLPLDGGDPCDASLVLTAKKVSIESYKHMDALAGTTEVMLEEGPVCLLQGCTGHEIIGGFLPHSLGTISIKSDEKKVFISFHGSKNVEDWISDFWCARTPAPGIIRGQVHKGFSKVVASCYDGLLTLLKDKISCPEETEFIFTGHSLGGATATLAASRFACDFAAVFPGRAAGQNQIKIITFSAPRVGDPDFANHIERIFGPNIVRFVSELDIVPNVPLWGQQAGNQIDVLFEEQVSSRIEQDMSLCSQPGLTPKIALLKDRLEPFVRFAYNTVKAAAWGAGAAAAIDMPLPGLLSLSSPAATRNASKAVLSGVGLFTAVSHMVPGDEHLSNAFFQYKIRTACPPEGACFGVSRAPGETSLLDQRRPVIKWVLAKCGGY